MFLLVGVFQMTYEVTKSRASVLMRTTQPPLEIQHNILVLLIHQLESDATVSGNDYARDMLDWLASYLEVVNKKNA